MEKTDESPKRGGDEHDFDAIYKEYMPQVIAAIRGVLGPCDEFEDVVQMAFIEVFRSLPSFEGRSKLSTWIRRIAVNVSYQHIRQRQRDRRMVLQRDGEESLYQRLKSRDEFRLLRERETIRRVFDIMEQVSDKKRVYGRRMR